MSVKGIQKLLSDQFLSSWEELIDFGRLRRYRTERVVSALKRAGLQGFISFKSDNIRYISSIRPITWEAGHLTRNIVLTDSNGKISLFVASGDFQRVKQNDPWLTNVKPLASMEDAGISSNVVADQLIPELASMGLLGSKLGLDSTTFYTIEAVRRTLESMGCTLVDGDDVLRDARKIKSSDEVRLLRGSAAMVDAGIEATRDGIESGRSENEIAGAALRTMYALGTEWMPSNPSVCSGRGPPRHFSTEKVVKEGENVVVDLSATNDGYCTRASRTFVAGKATSGREAVREFRSLYESALLKMNPGRSLREVMSDFVDAAHGKYLEPRLSFSGQGLSLIDAPYLSGMEGAEDERLEENMVVNVAARARDSEGRTFEISDVVHITGSGPIQLTRYQEDLD